MALENLRENEIIRSDFLPGPARVKKFEPRKAFTLLEVTIEGTGEYRSLRLTQAQIDQIEVLHRDPAILSGDPEEFFLSIEANRIRLAHQFDPMLAVSVSQVDPLPHQIEAVYHYALEMPRLRFLIADDPGAGKTIMAGLIIKELQYRRIAERILIVAPGHLKYQWQRELKEKFGLSFRLIDRTTMRSAWGENVWEEHPHAITSIDFLKQDDVKASLSSGRWDLAVVDEAHKMSAYSYETREKTKVNKTQRYQVGEILSRQAEHMLFLTATPHRGDEENFRLFLDLLRPGFFAKTELLKESVERQDNPVFIRRLKEDMKTFDGRPIFPPRTVRTVSFRMNPEEIELYNAVTSYVKNYYDQAKENRHITFAMLILQRRLTSSVHAILSSLERRRAKLGDLLRLPEKIRSDERYEMARMITEEELEELSEEERWEIEDRLEQISLARNIHEVEAEIVQLDALIEQAKRVRSQEVESKLGKLRNEILGPLGDRKLLIFTEHRDTLNYLEEKLREWGYSVITIHGGMDLDARVDAERTFRNSAQIMVATEAAGEGINLQFCSMMVNYDIPWNPNRLEQRMGRVHRYGQDREVLIWNLISKDTREGEILDRLFDKLERMRQALGTDRVFDIVGEIIPGTDLSELLKDAILRQRRMEEIEDQIERITTEETTRTLERVFLSSLASRHIDYTGLLREKLEAEENRLVPEYVEDFFLRGFRRLGGKIVPLEVGYRIDSVPFELRKLNDNYSFKNNFGKVHREYPRVTFEKEVARRSPRHEFVAPGHPLLESLNHVILEDFHRNAEQFAIFTDPEAVREGALWFVEGVVTDGTGAAAGRRVFCLLQRPDGAVEAMNPSVLWDLEPSPGVELPDHLAGLLADRAAIEDHIVEHVLLPYREEIAERREHDAKIKERYGIRSLEYLLQESNQKLLDYDLRAGAGESMDIVIRNEGRNREQLEQRRADLQREIRLERNLTIAEPRILGVAAVVSAPTPAPGVETKPAARERQHEEHRYGGDGMRRDDEIELVGMRVAMEYEEANGWRPEDVSKEKHGGFDIRSITLNPDGSIGGVRYIEAKARARSGEIRLTANEWKKARHFGPNYWIYVVTNAGTDAPVLTRIPNPAARFREEEDIFATGFVIPESRWQGQPTDEDSE